MEGRAPSEDGLQPTQTQHMRHMGAVFAQEMEYFNTESTHGIAEYQLQLCSH